MNGALAAAVRRTEEDEGDAEGRGKGETAYGVEERAGSDGEHHPNVDDDERRP